MSQTNPMDSQNNNAVPVPVKGQKQIVYAIPAKPKPREPWWKQNILGLMFIWLWLMTALCIWVNP